MVLKIILRRHSMSKVSDHELQSMADEIREQAAQLRVLTFLSFIYTSDVVNRYLDIEIASYPVGRTGFSVLHNLVLHGGTMTPTNLSQRIFRSKHAVTRVVDRLERLGFVKRGAIGKDRRVRKVHITKEGLAFVKDSQAAGQQRLGSVLLNPLDQKQIEALSVMMKQIREHTLKLITDTQTKQSNSTVGRKQLQLSK
jgi:DNA-binding MarR family transcriptional regulator